MPFTPEDSAIQLTDEQKAKIATMSASEISPYLVELAVQQGLLKRDWDPSVLHEVQERLDAPQPKRFATRVSVDGHQHIIEADSPEALAEATEKFYREIFAQPAPRTDVPARDSQGRFAPQTDEPTPADEAAQAAVRADLDLRFKRGEVDTAQYLEQTGAVEKYLEARGVSLPALREVSDSKFVESWSDAADTFVREHPDWQGGEQNKQIVGRIVEQMGLVDARDKSAALDAAYEYARQNNLLVENEQAAALDAIATSNDPEEIRFLARKASGLFGR